MGFYINPKDMSKEEWFDKNVQCYLQGQKPTQHYLRDGDLVLCVWVMNSGFTALGIAFSKNEMEAFTDKDDPRMKRYGYFPRKIVEPYLHGQKIEGVDYADG